MRVCWKHRSCTCGDIHFNGMIEYIENRRVSRSEENESQNVSKTVNFICSAQNYVAVAYDEHALVYRFIESAGFELVHKTNGTDIKHMALSIKVS